MLVSDILDIKNIGIRVNKEIRNILYRYWPGKVSIIIPVEESINLHYLHKGTGGIAFRVPDNISLRNLLKETGPIIAPSANPEGKNPANNIKEAMEYFGDDVDYYKDVGECENCKASKIIRIVDNNIEIIRE